MELEDYIELAEFGEFREGKHGYKLSAVVHHLGSLNYGHYVAECQTNNHMLCYDDSVVAPSYFSPGSESAYLLFYQRVC